ncbi:MAG: hypothetical protein D6785_01150 [Planctomycetota bacterium]|nr:MAG: hypothetical protein D6785_01150 [Planctomycetota bacterium]
MVSSKEIHQRFLIVKELGKGALGEVFLVKDRLHRDSLFALKQLRGDVHSSLEKEAFYSEFLLLSQFHHPHIAKVFDFGITEEGHLYFTSEYIPGKDLLQFFRKNPDLDLLLELVVQIARGLEYIHSRGYVHCDIKPSHILVDEEVDPPCAKILDFSLARKSGRISRGTIEYTAPEVMKGLHVDGRADLYSLGMTLYHVILGKLPHSVQNRQYLVESHFRNERTPIEGNLQPQWQLMIQRLLAPEPSQRLQSANELITFINQIFEKDFALETESTQRCYISSGPLVGRSSEMGYLVELARQVFPFLEEDEPLSRDTSFEEMDLEKRVCLITGPKGIGKSRLLKELRFFFQIHQIPFYWLACQKGLDQDHLPFLELLRQIGIQFPSFRDQAFQMVEEMKSLRSHQSSPEFQGPLYPNVEGFVNFLLEVASHHPFVLFLEDLHLADESTLALFEYICRSLYISSHQLDYEELLHSYMAEAPLLLYASYNEDEAKEKAKEYVKKNSLTQEIALIELGPLEIEEIHELVQTIFNWKKTPTSLLKALYSLSNGNPLRIEEILSSLAQQKVLYPSSEGWKFQEKRLSSRTLKNFLENRWENLEKKEQRILSWISVINRPVTLALLQELAKTLKSEVHTPLEIFQVLESLWEKKIISKEFQKQTFFYFFTYSRFGKKIYADLDEELKRKIHLKMAEILQKKQNSFSSSSQEELVYHLEGAGKKEDLYPLFLECARKNQDIQSLNKAKYFYQKALSLAPTAKEKTTIYWETAHIYEKEGDFEKAVNQIDCLISINTGDSLVKAYIKKLNLLSQAKKWKEGQKLMKSLLAKFSQFTSEEQIGLQNSFIQFYLSKGDIEKAHNMAIQLVPLVQNKKNEQEAFLESHLGVIYFRKGDFSRAEEHFIKTLELWKELKDLSQMAKSLLNLGNCSLYLGELRKGGSRYKEALEIFIHQGDLYHQANCLNNLGALHLWGGRLKKSLHYQLEAYRIRRKMGADIGMSLCNIGKLLGSMGKYTEALQLLQASLDRFSQEENQEGKLVSYFCLGEIYTFLGAYTEAEKAFEKAESLGKKLPFSYYMARVALDKGKLYFLLKEKKKSEEWLWKAVKGFEKLFARKEQNLALLELAQEHLLLGANEKAKEVLSLLTIYPKEVFKDLVAKYYLVMSLFQRASGKLEKSLTSLHHARKAAEEMGDPEILLDVYHQKGLLYTEMGKYATASKYYILAMEKIREIYLHLSKEWKTSFLQDPRRQRIRVEMENLKKKAEEREEEILHEMKDSQNQERLFQENSPPESLEWTAEKVDQIYLNPLHFKRIWEEHQLLVRMQEINQKINSHLHISQLLPLILEASLELTGGNYGYILMKKDDSFRLEHALDSQGRFLRKECLQVLPLQELKERFQKRPLRIFHFKTEEASFIAFPLRVKGIPVGLLCLEKRGEPFSPRHLDILDTLGKQADISIENAFLVEKLRKIRKLKKNNDH